LLGYSIDEYQGTNIFSMMHPDEIEANQRLFYRLLKEPQNPINGQLRVMHHDGTWRWLEVMGVNSLNEPALQGVVINFRDITFRVTAEQELKKLNRSLQAISECNLSMVQMTDELDLLQEICRITVEVGGYPSSWIAYIENTPVPTLRPVAQFGFSESYENSIPLSGSKNPLKEEPPVKSLRLREPIIIPDISNSPCKTPWCTDAMARGFGAMIVLPLFFDGEEFGALMIYAVDASAFEGDEFILLGELASDLAYGIHTLRTRSERDRAIRQIERTNADLEIAYDATLEGWARALEMRERETAGHSRRVVEMTLALAKASGVPESEMVHIRRGALLHDIGKMGMPDSILLKPSSLSADEWIVMRQHPVFAYKLLNNIPYLRTAMDIPYGHHESWDGSGYPRGLKGEQIPIAARIFAVVDVWDALLSERPYRPAWPKDEVIRYLEGLSGKQFDPRVVRIFIDQVLGWEENG
jgi:PAS domain S-box-containing protein